ncbi:MAG: class I SAM-dependent methyltransferase [Chloroflexota bacterium]|nr:class I SAM-dependent methyltransferase [Chloroflexota bacterium]
MDNYYRGAHALHYNTRWHTFTERTLTHVLTFLKEETIQFAPASSHQKLHVLDVACGTGRLIELLSQRYPRLDAVGVDASQDMLTQARKTVQDQSCIHFVQAEVGPGERANLPFEPASFDVITCTNAFHDLRAPLETLQGLRTLLTPGGILILEDYARRPPPFPWNTFERIVRWVEGTYVQAYTLEEAHALCTQAGYQALAEEAFKIDWLWRGWEIVASKI